MYDRAPRLLRLAVGGSTEAHVGPGSYQVPFPKEQVADGYAPFLSWSARESSFTVSSNTGKALPGPGQYNISKSQSNIKGGNSLQNREIRFKKIISDNPGPASYNHCYPGSLHMNQKLLDAKEQLQFKSSRPSTVNRSLDIPSIPSYRQSHGYEISDDGSIKRLSPPCTDSTLGPAYYSPQLRFVPIKSVTPAPGAYNETQTVVKSSKKTQVKSTPFGQGAARFTQIHKKEEVPGPGFYDILHNSIIGKIKNIYLQKQKKCAFGSSTPRSFFAIRKDSPRPSDDQRTWNSSVSVIPEELPNLKNNYAVFLSRAKKKPCKVVHTVFPAPGSYEVRKSYEISHSKRKYMPPRSIVAEKKHSSFLSGTPRYQEKVTVGPGPGEYNPDLKKSCPIPLFVKVPKRFEDAREDSPGPTTYELSPFLRHSVLKKTFNVTLPNFSLTERKNTITKENAKPKPSKKAQETNQKLLFGECSARSHVGVI
ncbi:sperm-tail PG-rich repeat-containing protein 2 isoform X7 [Perognathus longimembris pacificus]|uniref:sperm-tail PG-rich repeat-containing protein 2 isoform X7 n=1 Tax=Perognathus longimembris pacificus TaxID=214514 RepID=UPI0020195203|nr:sperm-tail PG-rich repeat-containing protein 2 isoform X7 [Perognathus longimembris pacificus]